MADLTRPNLQDPSQGGVLRHLVTEDTISLFYWLRVPVKLTAFDGTTTGTASGASAPMSASGRNYVTYQLSGTWTGTVNAQASMDAGGTWNNLDAGQTANGVYTVGPFGADMVRFNFTRSSGAVVCNAQVLRSG